MDIIRLNRSENLLGRNVPQSKLMFESIHRIGYHITVILTFLIFVECNQTTKKSLSQNTIDLEVLNFTVEEAPEWTGLFYRKQGWFGADGIFSIPLDGVDENNGSEETLIIFSDTYIGSVKENKPLPGNKMVNNTVAFFHGTEPLESNIAFHYNKDKQGNPTTYFVPGQRSGRKQHFWLGDGFVNKKLKDNLYIFAYHIEITGPNVFDFIEPSVSILKIPAGSRPPFDDYSILETPLHVNSPAIGEGNFGAGIFANTRWAEARQPDGYIYIFGCVGGDKNLIVARVRDKDFENFPLWRFWDGKGWSDDINACSPITNAVSNELSLTELPDGRYLLTFQVLGISDKVGIRVGESPIGPFGDIQEIYMTPEMKEGLWPYNAKAHPALSKPGELLISYNTITPDFWNDIQNNAHIYRPRFIKMIFE